MILKRHPFGNEGNCGGNTSLSRIYRNGIFKNNQHKNNHSSQVEKKPL